MKKLRVGFQGEKTANYFLSLLPPKKYHIFQIIRLPIGKNYFQVDFYLLSAKMGFIIEVKNFSDKLFFEKHQLTRTFNENDEPDIFQNPLTQTRRHKILLNYFFEKYQLSIVPIEYLVCISNQSSIIKISQGYTDAENRVCRAENLLVKIGEFGRCYKKDIIDQKTIGKIKRLILSKNTPLKIDMMNTYSLNSNVIIPGVECPNCHYKPMQYKGRKWGCPICHQVQKMPIFMRYMTIF